MQAQDMKMDQIPPEVLKLFAANIAPSGAPDSAGTEHDALLRFGLEPQGDDWTLPPITMRTILLLERIDSPFVRQQAILRDETGMPVLDKDGRPRIEPVIPTLTEIMTAFFVMRHQERPDLLDVIRDKKPLEQMVLQFAGSIDLAKASEIGRAISKQMAELNAAAKSAGLPDNKNGAQQGN